MSFATARAGVFLLPFWVASGLPALAGVGWRRAAILTVLAGPGFALMQMAGYAFAPLAHGAVFVIGGIVLN